MPRGEGAPGGRAVPVVMFTAADEPHEVMHCGRAGADDFLPKPVEPRGADGEGGCGAGVPGARCAGPPRGRGRAAGGGRPLPAHLPGRGAGARGAATCSTRRTWTTRGRRRWPTATGWTASWWTSPGCRARRWRWRRGCKELFPRKPLVLVARVEEAPDVLARALELCGAPLLEQRHMGADELLARVMARLSPGTVPLRAAERVPFFTVVEFNTTGGPTLSGFSHDASPQGLFVRTLTPAREGARLSLRLVMAGQRTPARRRRWWRGPTRPARAAPSVRRRAWASSWRAWTRSFSSASCASCPRPSVFPPRAPRAPQVSESGAGPARPRKPSQSQARARDSVLARAWQCTTPREAFEGGTQACIGRVSEEWDLRCWRWAAAATRRPRWAMSPCSSRCGWRSSPPARTWSSTSRTPRPSRCARAWNSRNLASGRGSVATGASTLVEAGVASAGLDPVLPERGRVHAVVHRRLVQLHERIGVEPVTAGPVPPIDHHDVGVGVLDQRVDEPHAERARADDEVVGLDPGALDHVQEP